MYDKKAQKKYYMSDKGKAARAAYMREYRKKNREKIQSKHRARIRGLSVEEISGMEKQQNGLCAICGLPPIHQNNHHTGIKKLGVDHNHVTEKIRGLLCDDCNQALGHLRVDSFGILNLLKAIEYLKQYE